MLPGWVAACEGFGPLFFDNLVMKEGKRRRRWPCDHRLERVDGFKELRRYADLSNKEADWV